MRKTFTKYKEDAKPLPEPIKPCTAKQFIRSFIEEFTSEANQPTFTAIDDEHKMKITGFGVMEDGKPSIEYKVNEIKSTEQARAEFLALKNKLK